MMTYEPEDTSEWDAAVERRMDELMDNREVIIDILNKLKVVDRFDFELEGIASRQLAEEAKEAQESRAEDMAIARYEYQNNY